MREGIISSYKDVNIFRIYFSMEKKIERVRDVIFVEEHKDITLPYGPVNSFLSEERIDSVFLDKSMMPNILANLTNSNH